MNRVVGGLLLLLVVAAAPALAVTGTIVSPDQKPIEGARVCYMLGESEGICGLTDKRGFFELPTSSVDRLRISAPGYLPRVIAAVTQNAAIVLDEAGGIWVRLKDKAGEPISSGEVHLLLSNGARKGPFPVNAKGVRVKSLAVGEYRVLASSPGMSQARAHAATVEAGKEVIVEVTLVPHESPAE